MFIAAGKLQGMTKVGPSIESHTSVLIHGTGPDGSTAITDVVGHPVVVTGDTHISAAQSKFGGGSIYLDSIGDYMQIAGDPSTTFGTGDWTVEGWWYFPVDASSAGGLWQISHVPGGFYNGSSIYVGTSSTVFRMDTGTSGGANSTTPSTAGVWRHIAQVKHGNLTILWINGVNALQLGDSSDYVGGHIVIGAFNSINNVFMINGYLNEFRILKGIAAYTEPFTPPTAPFEYTNPIGGVDLKGTGTNGSTTITDSGGHPVTRVGDTQISTAQNATGSIYFDGAGDYVQIAGDSTTIIGSQDFTIQMWANIPVVPNGAGAGFFQLSNVPGGLTTDTTGNCVTLYMSSNVVRMEAGGNGQSTSYTPPLTTWHHYALCRTGGFTSLFIDGVKQFELPDTKVYVGGHLAVGGFYGTGNLMAQYINDFKIKVGVAEYTANFTPPTRS